MSLTPASPAQPAGAPPASTQGGAFRAIHSFAWSPFAFKTWRAVIAVGIGLFVSVASVSVLSTLFSIGGSLLFLIVGIPFIGLGIEVARLFARVERWRMSMVDGRPLTPHPYRSFDQNPSAPWGPWIRQWAEAEFLDANRWLDVLYVLVAMPLTIIEFAVSVVLWSVSVSLLVAPMAWMAARAYNPGCSHPCRAGSIPSPWPRSCSSSAWCCCRWRPPPPAGWSSSTARWSRECCAWTPAMPCARTSCVCATRAPRPSKWRPANSAALSGTCTTAPSSAWS